MEKSKKIGIKRQKRLIKAANHKKRDIEMRKNIHLVSKNKKTKPQKAPKVLKPYKAVKLQQKRDKVYAEVRSLDHKDPRRQKVLVKLSIIKKKLGQ